MSVYKRPQMLYHKIPDHREITRYYPNFHVMISAETQQDYHTRLSLVPEDFGKVLVSAEPLLGPILLSGCAPSLDRIAGVIVGGENGRGARPMRPEWALGLRDQCAALAIPFYFKGWGQWIPCPVCYTTDHVDLPKCECYKSPWPGWVKAPDHHRTLAGREHNDFPF